MKLRITVDARIRISKRGIKDIGLTLRELKVPFEFDNPDYFKKQRMGYWVGNTPRKMTLVETTERELLLPRGGWPRLRELLRARRVAWEVDDRTVRGTGPLGLTYAEPPEWKLGPDQLAAARAIVDNRNGIVIGVCGSGKSELLLKAISDVGERTLVVVHTDRILATWVETAKARFGITESEVGILRGGTKRERNFTVGMVQTLLNSIDRDPKFVERWGFVTHDEAHHCSANTFHKLINSFPAKWRIAATATPKRKDGKEALMYDTFGSTYVPKSRGGGTAVGPRVIHEITDADLDRSGRIVPVDVVVVPTEFDFDLHLERRLAREGVERESGESSLIRVRAWAKRTKYRGILNTYAEMLDAMVRNRQRLALILDYLLPEVRAGETCLLLGDRRELCIELEAWLRREKIPVGRLMGSSDAKKQDRTAAELTDGTIQVAVGTTVADEGMNLPRLSRGFGCTPVGSNPGRFTQQVGRFKRRHPRKRDAVYFYFWDARVRTLRGHARAVIHAIQPPHRVWFSREPGERVLLTSRLVDELEKSYERC